MTNYILTLLLKLKPICHRHKFITNIVNLRNSKGLGEQVSQLVTRIDKISCYFSRELIFFNKVIINLCVWWPKKDFIGGLRFNNIVVRIKFKVNTIINGKFIDTKKIFGNGGDKQYVVEI